MNLSIDFIANFSSVIIGLCFALVVGITSKYHKASNRHLLLFFIIISMIQLVMLENTYEILSSLKINLTTIRIITGIEAFIIIGGLYALTPILYFYTHLITKNEELQHKWKHFLIAVSIPIIGLATILLETILASDPEKDFFKRVRIISLLGLTFQICYYIFKSLKLYAVYRINIDQTHSYDKGINLSWLRILLFSYLALFISLVILNTIASDYSLISHLLFNGFLLYIGINVIKQINVEHYTLQDQNQTNNTDDIIIEEKAEDKQEKDKYLGSSLKEERALLIMEKLEQYMLDHKPYLDQKLSIVDLSKMLGENYKYISQVINKDLNHTFVSFINAYRVQEAKELLTLEENKNTAVDIIGEEAGFQSKATFYQYFKKETGLTPSKYRDKFC